MLWLQLPSLAVSIYPRLPTSLSQRVGTGCSRSSTSSPAPRYSDGCRPAAAMHRVVLGNGSEEHNIHPPPRLVSLPGAWGGAAVSAPSAPFLLSGGLLIPR